MRSSNFSSSVFLTRVTLREAAAAGSSAAATLVELEDRMETNFRLPKTHALATQMLRYGGTHAALALHTDCSPVRTFV